MSVRHRNSYHELVCLLRTVPQSAKGFLFPTYVAISAPVGYYQLRSFSNSSHLAASLVRNRDFYFTPELPDPLWTSSTAQQEETFNKTNWASCLVGRNKGSPSDLLGKCLKHGEQPHIQGPLLLLIFKGTGGKNKKKKTKKRHKIIITNTHAYPTSVIAKGTTEQECPAVSTIWSASF